MRWCSVVPVVLFVVAGACGGNDDGPEVVTGRVMSLTPAEVCVSPDRGATQTCVVRPAPDAVEGIEVGVCAEVAEGDDGRRQLRAVDEPACAAGDVGD